MRAAALVLLVLLAPAAAADHPEPLRVVDLRNEPATLAEGDRPTIHFTVENTGRAPLAPFEGDCILNGRGVLGTRVDVLAPGERATFRCDGDPLPARAPELTVQVAARDVATMHRVLDDGGRTFRFPVRLDGAPALEVARWSVEPSAPRAGDLVRVAVVLHNGGDAEVRAMQAALSLGERLLDSARGPLPAGTNVTLQAEWRATAGDFPLILDVDASHDPADPSFVRTERLVVGSRPPTGTPRADLVLLESNWTRYRGHAPFDSLSVLVRNAGIAPSGPFHVLASTQGREELGEVTAHPGLAPGEEAWVHLARIHQRPPLVVVIDPYEEVAELEEADNRAMPEARDVPVPWALALAGLVAGALARRRRLTPSA